MTKPIPFYLLPIFIIILGFGSCKKDDKPVEERITGAWQLNKITFIETNVSYPLDSFRNVFNVDLTLNSDFSFSETEEIGGVSIGPLDNISTSPTGTITIAEHYNSPRNAKARYLISKLNYASNINSHSFSFKQDSLVFKVSYNPLSSVMEQVYSRKFNLKNNNELDIERLDLIVFNKESSVSLTHKLKFSYRRK